MGIINWESGESLHFYVDNAAISRLGYPIWFGMQGNYYEGFVDNASSVLEIHKRQTVTTWAKRKSTSNGSACTIDKENTLPESVRSFVLNSA